jgi:hypothetical protein
LFDKIVLSADHHSDFQGRLRNPSIMPKHILLINVCQ